MNEPSFEHILQAHCRIRPHIHKTPVLTSRSLDQLCSAAVFFKCENFQKTGSFKIRGAINAVLSLSPQEAARGVATHSSGNHAAALAFAARSRGVKAYVVMPKNAPPVKREAVLGYGAEVIECEPTMEAREEGLRKILNDTGAVPIHPFNDARVIAGQGSAALELCETVGKLDAILAPIGGGGLLSGTAIAVSAASPGTRIFGAEPERADDAARSFRAGRVIQGNYPDTIADGLRTTVGALTFSIIQEKVSKILTVSERDIVGALHLVFERMKIVIEPSAAVSFAALLRHRPEIPGKKIGVIFSGGNIDTSPLIDGLATSSKQR